MRRNRACDRRLAVAVPRAPRYIAANLPTSSRNAPESGARSPHVPPVHLPYARPVEDLSGWQAGPQQHPPVLLSGRQDRRARRQRRRQVDRCSRSWPAWTRNGPARRWVADGARVGYLPQEPKLDESLTVRENVMLGVAPQKAILDRYNELAMNYSDETADEMTNLQDEIEAKGLWDLDSKIDQAMDALRCPPDDWEVSEALGRRAPPRRPVQAAAGAAGAAAARRADQPSRRRDHRLARRPSADLSGRDPDRHPRSLLPRQRHQLDPRARSRPGHSLRGQLLGLVGAEAEAPRPGRPRGRLAPEDAGARAGMDGGFAQGAPGQEQGPHPAL